MSKKIKKIVIGSYNEGKIHEIKSMLKRTNIKIYSTKKFNINEPRETGLTFAENSIIKSKNASIKSNLPAIADDSGLCIPVLNNYPGIYSARWAGQKKDFYSAMSKIENQMNDICLMRKIDRKAYFCCALSLYFPDNTYKIFEGRVYGHIQFPPKGNNGFGYDPIFVPNGYKKTFGEMNHNFKKKISHRAKAFKKIKIYLVI